MTVPIARRSFLRRWAVVALAGAGVTFLGAAGAYELFAGYSRRQLVGLNTGDARRLYSLGRRQATAPPAGRNGAEPPLFVAQATAARIQAPAIEPLTIAIPAIDLRSDCVELTTQVVDGQLVWKTADHAVGHHVGTAMPGDAGNSVFSGHISSPLSHEGNVFHRLPELATKLGSDVEIVMQGGRHVHYRIAGSLVVSPADVWIMDPTPAPILTLITCIPDGVYTERLAVTGLLVQ